MYELGGAKQAGSTYAHGGPAGKRGKSLREGRKNTPAPLPLEFSGQRPKNERRAQKQGRADTETRESTWCR